MISDAKLLARFLREGRPRSDSTAQSARARETIKRSRPWEQGRIGNIETLISRTMTFADPNKLFTTTELAIAVYANPKWDQNFRFRKKGEKPPQLKSWHYLAIRKAAPTFCICVGRATARGRPWLWKLRRDGFFPQVRKDKRGTRQSAKSLVGRESSGKC
jgi:hypothetical protein